MESINSMEIKYNHIKKLFWLRYCISVIFKESFNIIFYDYYTITYNRIIIILFIYCGLNNLK
jgi:hypothetical protein